MSAVADLDNILDLIDSKKRKLQGEEDHSSSSSSSSSSKSSALKYDKDPLASYYWTKHYDVASNNYYYHNNRTKVTQWEVPEDYVEEEQLYAQRQQANSHVETATALFHSKRPGVYSYMCA